MPHRDHVEIGAIHVRCSQPGCPFRESVPCRDGGSVIGCPSVVTPQQREVIAWLPTGATVKEIAARLRLSPSTVKGHIMGAKAALGLRTTAELVALAVRCGLEPREATARPNGRLRAPVRRSFPEMPASH